MKELDKLVIENGLEVLWDLFPHIRKPDWNDALYYMTKEDGSLISTFSDKGYLGLKSKTSLESDQVYLAGKYLATQPELKERLTELANNDYTVNMEYVGPDNRIVLGYTESKLRILNVRNNASGEYVEMDEIYNDPILRPYMTDVFDAEECSDCWETDVRKMEGIEGYIIVFADKMFKLKTDWYCSLHHTKDSINSNRRLAEVCVQNGSDDLRGMFIDDQSALDKIDSFEAMYRSKLEESFKAISAYSIDNHHLDRREYAINAQVYTKKLFLTFTFGIIMQMYNGFDAEKCVNQLNKVFVKDTDIIIPTEYK